MQATSCEVARAHEVADPITLFCTPWSSALLATPFALSTNAAVALATAFARAKSVSCNEKKDIKLSPIFLNFKLHYGQTRLVLS